MSEDKDKAHVEHVALKEMHAGTVDGELTDSDDDDIMQLPQDRPAKGAVAFVIILCLFSSIGGILFGYDTGINGGVQVSDSFIDDLCVGTYVQEGKACHAAEADLQPHEWLVAKGRFVSLLSLGAMFGAVFGGWVTEKVGRRWTVAIGCCIFLCATLLCISSGSMTPLLVGRFTLGFPVGMLSFVVPMYAAEVAPAELRGVLASLMQFSIVVGILVATVVAIPFEHADNGWRMALGVCGIPALILGAGIFCFPESPRWLCKYKGIESATDALKVLRKTAEVDTEVGEIAVALDAEKAEGDGNYSDLFAKDIRGRLAVAMVLQLCQQLTGVNSIFYFAPTIFASAGMDNPLMAGLICGTANLVGTIIGLRLVDSSGRRTLLLIGAVGMTVGMTMSAAILAFFDLQANPFMGYIAVLCICVFVVFFAFSWGPICWVYPAEIFPMRVRAKAVSLATLCNWIMNVMVGDSVPSLLEALGAPGLFFMFGICGIACWAFVFFFVPETAGKTLEEINRMWVQEADVISPRGRGYSQEATQPGVRAESA